MRTHETLATTLSLALAGLVGSVGCKQRRFNDAGVRSGAPSQARFSPGDLTILAPQPRAVEEEGLTATPKDYAPLSSFLSYEEFLVAFPSQPARTTARPNSTDEDFDHIKAKSAFTDAWIVVGWRVEPCVELREKGCTFEVRLVAQPWREKHPNPNVRARAAFWDASAHLVYQTQADSPETKTVLQAVKAFSDRAKAGGADTSRVAAPHPGLKTRGDLKAFADFVRATTQGLHLHELALSTPSNGGSQWDFSTATFSGEGQGRTIKRAGIPLVGGSDVQAVTQANLGALLYFPSVEAKTRILDADGLPASWNKDLRVLEFGQRLGSLFEEKMKSSTARFDGLDASAKSELAQGLASTFDIENPYVFNQRMGDCVSCHSAQPLRALAVETLGPSFGVKAERASHADFSPTLALTKALDPASETWIRRRAFSNSESPSNAYSPKPSTRPGFAGIEVPLAESTRSWIVRHFGYVDTTPVLSQRTVNETGRAAEILADSNYPF
ncbi:MAG: hypothetical protein IOD12_16495 [Silvanigrellales bacterium]|nr:hypothetical protein [Silvanigrellales bacterium]